MKMLTITQKKQQVLAYILLFILAVLSITNASAQREATNWYFGNKAGLNLENVTYTMSDGALVSNANCASICSPGGDLRVYTNGVTLWNAKHLVVEGGTGLSGNSNASQGCIIIPVPLSNHLFYVFTAPANGVNSFGQPDSLRYTIVDMSANDGFGQVDATHKNVALYGVVEEKITSVMHGNGTDIWIIAHGFKTNKYVSYKLSATGLEGPYESTAGMADLNGGRGCMKASPNGKMVARTMTLQNKCELVNFDNLTGLCTNNQILTNLAGCYGVDFSSYSSRLYVSTIGVNQNYINQFNLKLETPNAIEGSKYVITPPAGAFPTAIQLGYNGVLYCANAQSISLGKITNADTLGTALNYFPTAITVPGTIYSGLPAFTQSYFKRNATILSAEDDAISTLEIYPNPSNGVFRLNVGKNKSEAISVNVYNMTGSKVFSADRFENGQNIITIDLTGQPSGLYFFDVNTPAGKTVKRMVIN